jgi:tRNA(Ile2) C34 agmatinyltransferase TiaS
MIYIGLDDTDTLDTRGTGNLARRIAAELSGEFIIHGVVRHQLLVDPRVPCTSHNSTATILLGEKKALTPDSLKALFLRVKDIMLDNFNPGSDPGLCVLSEVPGSVVEFGLAAKKRLVSQGEARKTAHDHGILLEGLGGTEDGVIGALASVGLSSTGSDGRYVLVGSIRELGGLQPVATVISAGVSAIMTMEGEHVTDGLVLTDKLRPARRNFAPIAYVKQNAGHWEPLKLD